jgi:hypothetical protein
VCDDAPRHTILYVSGAAINRPKATQPKYLCSGARVWPEGPALGKLDKTRREVQFVLTAGALLN